MFRIFDDLLITGKGSNIEEAIKDHETNVRKFLERCRQCNIKLNKVKFKFKCSEVSFIGHLFEGLKPDPHKVVPICSIPRPDDVQAVQRFVNTVKDS